MFEFKLPDLGEGIHEAEILKWHIQPGDLLKEDAPVVRAAPHNPAEKDIYQSIKKTILNPFKSAEEDSKSPK